VFVMSLQRCGDEPAGVAHCPCNTKATHRVVGIHSWESADWAGRWYHFNPGYLTHAEVSLSVKMWRGCINVMQCGKIEVTLAMMITVIK